MYDVIVIGARCAGSPTAMLLARKGYHVLLVDRATFPSDTLSTHQVQIKGNAALQRWGLLDTVLNSNCPPVKKASFHTGSEIIHGAYPALDGVNTVICPRRTILDKILVDAAEKSGVEVRQDFLVEELKSEDNQVKGILGRVKSGGPQAGKHCEEKARLVIGADGKHSLVAKTVNAPEYNVKPTQTCAYYTYWAGLELAEGELHAFPGVMSVLWPTNDSLALIYTGYPIGEFASIRTDIEGYFWKTVEGLPGIAERLHHGTQADRFYGTADLPNFYRRPYGPGWALVGDAGMDMDPITGQGIGNAFRDAERLTEAVDNVFTGKSDFNTAMASYEQARNKDTMPMYELTVQLASFTPASIEQQALFSALARNSTAADQFFGALSGSVPLRDFLSPANIFRTLGAAGLIRLLVAKLKPAR